MPMAQLPLVLVLKADVDPGIHLLPVRLHDLF